MGLGYPVNENVVACYTERQYYVQHFLQFGKVRSPGQDTHRIKRLRRSSHRLPRGGDPDDAGKVNNVENAYNALGP